MNYIKRIYTPAYWADAATMCCVFLLFISTVSIVISTVAACVYISSSDGMVVSAAILSAITSFIGFLLFGCLSGFFYSVHRIMTSAEQISMSNDAMLNLMRLQAKAQAKIEPK